MKISGIIIFLLFISSCIIAQPTEKKILFKSDSIEYCSSGGVIFFSSNDRNKWDTIFNAPKINRKDPNEMFVLNGGFDTAQNILFPDAHTIFILGWDGTYLYASVIYCSSDCGKTWTRTRFEAANSNVSVKYLAKISDSAFFIYLRNGIYATTSDTGKTWATKNITTTQKNFSGMPPEIAGKEIRIIVCKDNDCKNNFFYYTTDGGKNWKKK